MSTTELTALKAQMQSYLRGMIPLCRELVSLIRMMHDLDHRLFALCATPTGHWQRLPTSAVLPQLSIFSQFSYDKDQDPKEAIRLPAVLQLDPRQHRDIHRVITDINQHKDKLHILNHELKALEKRRSAQIWQDIHPFASIIQILRHISLIDAPVDYLGLSYMVKPVVKTLSKKEALVFIDTKEQFYIDQDDYLNKSAFLDALRDEVSHINEEAFELKLARQGAPRMMLNARANAQTYQVMASLPVFVFSPTVISVSKPACLKRKPRSDKRIPLGSQKSEFGLYLIPRQS